MRHYLPILLLFIGFTAFGQKSNFADSSYLAEQARDQKRCPGCGCFINLPWTHISHGMAQKRFDEYASKLTASGQNGLEKEVVYKPEGAYSLLKFVTTKAIKKRLKYDGFRTYFAMYPLARKGSAAPDSAYNLVPDHQFGKLTLIYVPTTRVRKKTYRHLDDTKHCLIIRGDSIVELGATFASMWIRKAEPILSNFETTRRKTDTSFRETRCLWYSNGSVRHLFTRNGLLDILECRLCCHDITSVHAGFAAFLDGASDHKANQLSLVFTFGKGEATNYLSLYSGDLPSDERKKLTLTDSGSGGSDTGKPCPPPTPCTSTTAGAVLPI
jgi:hypothetical protein